MRILELLDNADTITYGGAYFEGFYELFATLPWRDVVSVSPRLHTILIKLIVCRAAAGDGLARLNELQAVYEQDETLRDGRENRPNPGEKSAFGFCDVFCLQSRCAYEGLHHRGGSAAGG